MFNNNELFYHYEERIDTLSATLQIADDNQKIQALITFIHQEHGILASLKLALQSHALEIATSALNRLLNPPEGDRDPNATRLDFSNY